MIGCRANQEPKTVQRSEANSLGTSIIRQLCIYRSSPPSQAKDLFLAIKSPAWQTSSSLDSSWELEVNTAIIPPQGLWVLLWPTWARSQGSRAIRLLTTRWLT